MREVVRCAARWVPKDRTLAASRQLCISLWRLARRLEILRISPRRAARTTIVPNPITRVASTLPPRKLLIIAAPMPAKMSPGSLESSCDFLSAQIRQASSPNDVNARTPQSRGFIPSWMSIAAPDYRSTVIHETLLTYIPYCKIVYVSNIYTPSNVIIVPTITTPATNIAA